jgi:hypothetical protein
VIANDDKSLGPGIERFRLEYLVQARDQLPTAGIAQSYQYDAWVSPGMELAQIREVEILGEEDASFGTAGAKYGRVVATGQLFVADGMCIMPSGREKLDQFSGKILFEFQFHATAGNPGNGRSS